MSLVLDGNGSAAMRAGQLFEPLPSTKFTPVGVFLYLFHHEDAKEMQNAECRMQSAERRDTVASEKISAFCSLLSALLFFTTKVTKNHEGFSFATDCHG